MGKLLERLIMAEEGGKIEIRGDRKFSNGTFREIPNLVQIENCKLVDGCKERKGEEE